MTEDRGGGVTVRYWAAAREAAGAAEERYDGVATLGDLLAAVTARRAGGPGLGRLARVLSVCSFLVDEVPREPVTRPTSRCPPVPSSTFSPRSPAADRP